MTRIYLVVALCVTMEIVFSVPLLERNIMKRSNSLSHNRRGIEWNMDGIESGKLFIS